MVHVRQQILDRIREHVPFGPDPEAGLHEGANLTDVGLTSLHLITLLTIFEQRYGVDLGKVYEAGSPVTIGDLVTTIVNSLGSSRDR